MLGSFWTVSDHSDHSDNKWYFFMKYFDKKTHWKHLKMMIFTLKIINFDQFYTKISPSGEPPTGSHLRRWACLRRPAARGLNGDENIGKTSIIVNFQNLWEKTKTDHKWPKSDQKGPKMTIMVRKRTNMVRKRTNMVRKRNIIGSDCSHGYKSWKQSQKDQKQTTSIKMTQKWPKQHSKWPLRTLNVCTGISHTNTKMCDKIQF